MIDAGAVKGTQWQFTDRELIEMYTQIVYLRQAWPGVSISSDPKARLTFLTFKGVPCITSMKE